MRQFMNYLAATAREAKGEGINSAIVVTPGARSRLTEPAMTPHITLYD
jgi:hypothetical protein